MQVFSYLIDNIRLRFFRNLETYKCFSSLKKDWQKSDWGKIYKILRKQKNWIVFRQKFHQKVVLESIRESDRNFNKIDAIIQKRAGYKALPAVIIVRGQPGAGKSTFIKNTFKIKSGTIGPDAIRNKLKKGFLLTGKNDNQYDLEAYFVTLWIYEKIFSLGKSFITERTLEYVEDLETIINLAIKNKYQLVYVMDIITSLKDSLTRLENRKPGEDNPIVPTKAVVDSYTRINTQRKNFIRKLKNTEIKCIYDSIN